MCRDSCCVFVFRTLEERLSPPRQSGEAAGRPRGSETERQPKSWRGCEEMFEVWFAKMKDWVLLPPRTETHDPEASCKVFEACCIVAKPKLCVLFIQERYAIYDQWKKKVEDLWISITSWKKNKKKTTIKKQRLRRMAGENAYCDKDRRIWRTRRKHFFTAVYML